MATADCKHHWAKGVSREGEPGEMQVCTLCSTRRPKPVAEAKSVKLESREQKLNQPPPDPSKRITASDIRRNQHTAEGHQARLKRSRTKPLTWEEVIKLYGQEAANKLFGEQ